MHHVCDAVVSVIRSSVLMAYCLRHLVNIAIMTVTYKLTRNPILGTTLLRCLLTFRLFLMCLKYCSSVNISSSHPGYCSQKLKSPEASFGRHWRPLNLTPAYTICTWTISHPLTVNNSPNIHFTNVDNWTLMYLILSPSTTGLTNR